MLRKKITIIVPVYKAEKYLSRCVDSILEQTFPDFELILIDDGSPDKSGALCDDFARNDARIRVFHQENKGVSAARQKGLDNATGDYIIHADPDDWVEPDMLQTLYNEAIIGDYDVVFCDLLEDYNDESYYNQQKISTDNSDKVLRDILTGRIHGSLCNKLIRTELYTRYNLSFPVGMTYMEDAFICCSVLANHPRISYINKAFYHYDKVINDNSLSTSSEASISESSIESIAYFVDSFIKKLGYFAYEDELNTRIFSYKRLLWNSAFRTKSKIVDRYSFANKKILQSSRSKCPIGLQYALKGYYYWGTIRERIGIFHWKMKAAFK